MTDTHAAAAAPRTYAPRQSNAERAAAKREAVQASIPAASDALRERAEKQAKAAQIEAVQRQIDAMDDMTPENIRRAALRAMAQLKGNARELTPEDFVWVTVRTKGAGKISMGEHVPPYGEVHYEKGERFEVPLNVARIYDERGWVDIDGGD
jgi:hypothetical protein